MLNDVHDLVSVAEDMKLPETLEEVIPRKAYMVPMNMELLSSVQAVCFGWRSKYVGQACEKSASCGIPN